MPRHLVIAIALVCAAVVQAQEPSAKQIAQERAQAELDAPRLAEVLELAPGMTIADVGAGGGAMTVVLGKWIGSGRVFATDIGQRQLDTIRDYVKREGLTNVTVLEGAADSTNLPAACCDAVFLRLVYHHITDIEPFNQSLKAALKPGGRLAIIDFVPTKGSALPKGVPANREGHGVPIRVVIDEISSAGLPHARTIERWPPDDKNAPGFLVLFKKPSALLFRTAR